MAQSDWEAISTNANSYSTSVSGTAVQHNSVSNAITSSGTWFRNFQSSSPGYADAIGALVPVNNSLLTSSVGYPYGYTYSLRTWMRIDNSLPSYSRQAGAVLNFKSNSTLTAQTSWVNLGATGFHLKGYYLLMRQNTNGNLSDPQLFLRCNSNGNSNAYNSSLDASFNNQSYEAFLMTVANSTWLRVRMDVMSLPSADRITIFSGSQAGAWTQLHQVDISRNKIAAYIPWNNNPSYPSDNAGAATAGHMGIAYYSNVQVTAVRFDGFEVYREAITI